MGYASQSGRARTSARNPQAHAICDRCGFRYNRVNLRFQYDWRGASMQNLQFLVCDICYDNPQEQLRAIVVPADPVPVVNPRIQDFVTASNDSRSTSGQGAVNYPTGIPVPGGNTRITQNADTRVTQQTGEPPHGLNQKPGTDPNAITYRNVIAAYNNGSGLIRLVLNTTNGMTTKQLVTINEVGGVPAANGNWVITVINATQIDLQASVFSGSYTSGGYVINNPSLPYGFTAVPETGSL